MAKVHVAVVQMRPVHLDLPRTLARLEERVREAASSGASLIAVGETVVPGYPAWLDHASDVARWDSPATKKVFARLRQNSVSADGTESARLGALAAELGVSLVIGANERVEAGPGRGTLYNSLFGWNERGERFLHHRKLVPTYTEKLVWGPGDAHGLRAGETAAGRIGALVCWEHWMPLARQALHDSGEDVHVAAWPTVTRAHQLASRSYAFEGRCYVLAAGSIMTGSDMPDELPTAFGPDELCLRGGSAIIGPDGEYVVEPVYDEETILTAELDLGRLDEERMTLDVSGHYARPEILRLDIDRTRRGDE